MGYLLKQEAILGYAHWAWVPVQAHNGHVLWFPGLPSVLKQLVDSAKYTLACPLTATVIIATIKKLYTPMHKTSRDNPNDAA